MVHWKVLAAGRRIHFFATATSDCTSLAQKYGARMMNIVVEQAIDEPSSVPTSLFHLFYMVIDSFASTWKIR